MSVINTNIKSLIAQDALSANGRKLSTAMERLSTGSRINSAADDAAGLGIATRMTTQVRGLQAAVRNANDVISVVQTAEGAMAEVGDILQRMRELSVQSASDQNSATDRSYLQAEVSQLSAEIDRIAGTTQFNSMNLLDGSYANKSYQIGANQGQTLGLTIGSMKASTLGVASSAISSSISSPTTGVTGAAAQGTGAVQTVVNLKFEDSDTYTFTIADDVSGLAAAGVAAKALDLTSEVSKQAFVDELNTNLKKAAVDTKIVGAATLTAGAGTVDLTDTAQYEKVKLSVSVGGASPVAIDLRSRLLSSAGTTSAVTAGEIATALNAELQAQFDDSVTLAQASGVFTLTDAQGRALKISQGAGDGTLFGTDSANAGALTVDKNIQSNLSAAWDGNNLKVTNSAGGKTTVAGYATVGTSRVIFDTVNDSQSGQNFDPISLVAAAATTDDVAVSGRVESSKLAMTFSDRFGDGTTSQASFKITNGAGDVYATVSALDVHQSKTDASVIAAIQTVLTTGIAALDDSDASFDVSDFTVAYTNGTLTITNSEGRSLAIEDYSSAYTTATVAPLNELGASKTLSSQNNMFSEVRLGVNSTSLTQILTANTTNEYDIYVDGIKSTDGFDLSAEFDGTLTGADLATAVQTKIAALTDVFAAKADGTASTAKADMTGIKVVWDDTSGELVVRDDLGRNLRIAAQSTNTFLGTGDIFLQDDVSGVANQGSSILADSAVAKGTVLQAASATLALNQTKGDFTFSLNGVFLDSGTNAQAGTVTWDSSQPFAGSTMQTKLDAMVLKLNSAHPTNVYSYSVSGNSVSFQNSDGGPLEFGGFKSGTGYNGLSGTVTAAAGLTGGGVIGYDETLVTANATGTSAVATTATLKLQGDDLVGFTVSDGKTNYTVAPAAIDISNATSAAAFATSINEALAGSSISATMDTDGTVYFNDNTGGQIALTAFNASSGRAAAWTPGAGQGDALTVSSGFVGSSVAASSSVVNVGGGSSSVAQISLTTVASASQALTVIDSALEYVNAERSKLGAVENRLEHTINNLTNIVTNTQASRSRILDTDYAAETTELARSQIIQQAATAMLAQANQQPQSVLSLLQ
ncbi:flagellin [Burkholderiaceae bacterium]